MRFYSAMAATFVSLDAPVSSKDPPPGGARIARDEKQRLGEHVNHRTAVVTLCLVYMFLLALAQGECSRYCEPSR